MALGQNIENVDGKISFYGVSNTDDSKENNVSHFIIKPYGGINFSKRFSWVCSLTQCYMPFNEDIHLAQDIWFKRLRLCENSLEGGTFNEKYADNEMELFGEKYKTLMTFQERITIPHNYVYTSYKDDQVLPALKKEITDDFVKFFNTVFLTRMFGYNLQNPSTAKKMRLLIPILRLRKRSDMQTEAKDIFEIDFFRPLEEGDNRLDPAVDLNEKGYFEIIRMSRTLYLLLGLNNLQNTIKFPYTNKSGKEEVMRNLTPETFYNPPIKNPNMKRSGFWCSVLNELDTKCLFLKIHQSFSDDKLYTGGNKPNEIHNYTYANFGQEENGKEDYVDFFVGSLLNANSSAADTVYERFKHNPNMQFLKRGISWSVNNYLLNPTGGNFELISKLIHENILAGKKQSTLLSSHVPLHIKKIYPYSIFPVEIKRPIYSMITNNEQVIYEFKTVWKMLSTFRLNKLQEDMDMVKEFFTKNQAKIKQTSNSTILFLIKYYAQNT